VCLVCVRTSWATEWCKFVAHKLCGTSCVVCVVCVVCVHVVCEFSLCVCLACVFGVRVRFVC